MRISTPPVSAGEIAALVREARRIVALGSRASTEERCAYLEHKVNVLERIAAHEGLLVDRRTTEDALVYARAQLEQHRAASGRAGAADA